MVMSAITVYVVDDDLAARDSVAMLVKSKGLAVETFESAEQFLAVVDVADYRGCLVVDVRMTGMTGLELLELLRKCDCHLPVIVVTGFADVPMAVRAMKGGAETFLEKPCLGQEMWTSISRALESGARREQRNAERLEVRTNMESLTEAEMQVLGLVVEGKPNKVIASALDLGLRTVELRRAKVMEKLQAESLADLVRKVLISSGGSAGSLIG